MHFTRIVSFDLDAGPTRVRRDRGRSALSKVTWLLGGGAESDSGSLPRELVLFSLTVVVGIRIMNPLHSVHRV